MSYKEKSTFSINIMFKRLKFIYNVVVKGKNHFQKALDATNERNAQLKEKLAITTDNLNKKLELNRMIVAEKNIVIDKLSGQISELRDKLESARNLAKHKDSVIKELKSKL